MARGKTIKKALLDASQAALFAGIEMHNKPNVSYRYQTAAILIINAWELALKAYIYKYIDKKRIYEKDGVHTISFSEASRLVKDHITKENRSFLAVHENLRELNDYRSSNLHFANVDLDPIVFMLMAKAVLNYDGFLKRYFNKDITSADNLIILPIGFKLPFDPIQYLTQDFGEAQNDFVNELISTIRCLNKQGVEDSIVVGFNLYTESVKKVANADIIAAIDQLNGSIKVTKRYRETDDPKAPAVRMIPDLPPLKYSDLKARIKQKNPDIKIHKRFYAILADVKKRSDLCRVNYLDPLSKNGAKTAFYDERTVDYIISEYYSDKEY